MTTAVVTSSQHPAANSRLEKRSTNLTHGTNPVHPIVISCGFVGLLIALSLHPRVQVNSRVVSAVWIAVVLISSLLCAIFVTASKREQSLTYKVLVVRAHYIQLLMHAAIYTYWAMYWPRVYYYLPLLAIQVVFVFLLDMLVFWFRGDQWVLGLGAFPIVLSTNLFLWFKDDWFYIQLLMLATAVFCKNFIKWNRDGFEKHIFNPSGAGLFIFSIGLILSKNTDMTWGREIAESLRLPPDIYIELFCLGLVVQALFSVTLITLCAAATLYLLNILFTALTGVYYFIDSGISVSLFLGLHFLITDPATSPRTVIGKVIFGSLYGGGAFAGYGLLAALGVPIFYDKLLPLPALNVAVRMLDGKGRQLGAFMQAWNPFAEWSARQANLACMAIWVLLFVVMTTSGFLIRNHPGQSVSFWQQACVEKKWNSCPIFVAKLVTKCRENSPDACAAAGEALEGGHFVPQDRVSAGSALFHGCELGSETSCAILTRFILDGGERELVRACDHGEGVSCWVLGSVYADGKVVTSDRRKSIPLFTRSCMSGWMGACGRLGESYLYGEERSTNFVSAAQYFKRACDGKYGAACSILGEMYTKGIGLPADRLAARQHFRQACALGVLSACRSGERTE